MQAGTVIAVNYEVIGMLGKGGMGAVYRARHRQLNRQVAIKVLHNGVLSDERSVARFRQEARATAALSHPNITSVFDFGELTDGSCYLVMEYLPGRPLSQVLAASGPLPANRISDIGSQIADGLGYAHSQGIIHRDLKPANVILLEDHHRELVKIVDFGIAKQLGPEGNEAQALTKTGEVFGSPLYMSPEQCGGYKLDGRSDIYSLGCVLYELVTGVLPLKGNNSVQTICKHMQEQPKPFAQVRPDLTIHPNLECIVMRCLEKSPDRRFQTMDELSAALRSWQGNSKADTKSQLATKHNATHKRDSATPANGVSALSSSRSDSQANSQSSPKLIAAIASIVLALGGLGALGLWITTSTTSHRSAVETEPTDKTTMGTGISILNSDSTDVALQKVHAYLDVRNEQQHSGTQNVQMVAVYMGFGFPDRQKQGKVIVKLRHREPYILVLNGYTPTVWHLEPAGGKLPEKIYLVGYNEQKLQGVDGVPVVRSFYQDWNGNRFQHAPFEGEWGSFLYDDNQKFKSSPEFERLSKMVQRATHNPVTRMQAQYINDTFVVD